MGERSDSAVLPVTSDYFRTLVSTLQRGREFSREDEVGTSRVVLSDDLWQTRFDGDPSVIGTTIRLSDRPAGSHWDRAARIRGSDRWSSGPVDAIQLRRPNERARLQLCPRLCRAASERGEFGAGPGGARDHEPGDGRTLAGRQERHRRQLTEG
ncbi:MAG: ABC transporter permease [Longimicrobiales bacterium]